MPASTPAAASGLRPSSSFASRHFAVLATLVLTLAAVNLGVRLGAELVTEWDESLYAGSAAEMVASGNWVATTFDGELDYYNAKPPLNVWLIAASFNVFGKNLIALRLPSALSAWLTVLVLLVWARKAFGPGVALIAGIVLSTNLGFIHVHAGRSADPDALLTLLILLAVIALWAAETSSLWLILISPLMAATFLLKGSAVLMLIAIVLIVEISRRTSAEARWGRWTAYALGLPFLILPVSFWVLLRWRIDHWQFLRRVMIDDFVGHTLHVLEGQDRNTLFFFGLIQKHEYGWLLAVTIALVTAGVRWRQMRSWVASAWTGRHRAMVVWMLVTLLVPTLMRTKMPWYLNPFYPAFALGTAWIIGRCWMQQTTRARAGLVAACTIVLLAAESRLIWYSFTYRDLAESSQGLLLTEREALSGHSIFSSQWAAAERFVVSGLGDGRIKFASDAGEFLDCSELGDFLLARAAVSHPTLTLVRANGRDWLYRRTSLR